MRVTLIAELLLAELKSNGSSWRASGVEFAAWREKMMALIRRTYGNKSPQETDFNRRIGANSSFIVSSQSPPIEQQRQRNYEGNLPGLVGFTEALVQDLHVNAPPVITPPQWANQTHRPLIFIAHGGHSVHRDYLELFLWRRGYRPVIVEELPSLGMSPDSKVDHYMSKCQFGVICAEVDRAAVQDGKSYPRLNIIDEMVRIRRTLGDRFIVLLEKGLSLNTDEQVTYERFGDNNLDKASDAVLRELNAHDIRGLDELGSHAS